MVSAAMGVDQMLGIIASLVMIGAEAAAAYIFFQKDKDWRDRGVIMGVSISLMMAFVAVFFFARPLWASGRSATGSHVPPGTSLPISTSPPTSTTVPGGPTPTPYPISSLATSTPVPSSAPVSTSSPTPPPTIGSDPSAYEVSAGQFPATITGPGIVEWAGSPTGGCGIFELDQGQAFSWTYEGSYWIYSSQAATDTFYPQHKQEYFNKPGNQVNGCREGMPPAG